MPRDPVEFTRITDEGHNQRCGNRIQIEDADGNPVTPIAAGGVVSIDQTTPGVTNGVAVRYIDEAGVVYGIKEIDGKPRTSAMPYAYDIAEGNVPGHIPFYAFGVNLNVGTAWETVHSPSTLRTYLAAAERLQIASTDADDDGAPLGNGARTVSIVGLDANYDALAETVIMNGVGNVLTDAAFLRVLYAQVLTAGATGFNEGIITISNNADTIVLEQIDVQTNISIAAAYTVPAGYTAYILQAMSTEGSTKGSQLSLWMRPFGGLWMRRRGISLLDSSIVLPVKVPMKVPEKTDFEIRAMATLAGAHVTGGLEGWIELN